MAPFLPLSAARLSGPLIRCHGLSWGQVKLVTLRNLKSIAQPGSALSVAAVEAFSNINLIVTVVKKNFQCRVLMLFVPVTV
jgi:hypothetical protein